MKHLPILFAALLFFSCRETSQPGESAFISFELEHSRRIPDNKVVIDIRDENGSITVHVTSEPMKEYAEKWEHTRIDTSFELTRSEFDALFSQAEKIDPEDIRASEADGMDGTTCRLRFGWKGQETMYEVWTPDYDTAKRRLADFLSLCKSMIRTGGLEEKDVL